MDQTPNTPTSNQNTPTSNQHIDPSLGFGQFQGFVSMLSSPQIPNQPTFAQTTSPPINFPNIQQNIYPQNPNYQQNYYPHNPHYQQYQTQPQSQQVVEETQVAQPQKTKKKATKTSKGKTTTAQTASIPWTDVELEALADAWCKTSQDKQHGNSHKADAYWESIRKTFHSLLDAEDYRNTDAVSSKWGQIRRKLTKFNAIYNKIENAKPSGWDEMKIFLAAKSEYKAVTKQDFKLDRVWRRIRKDPKWTLVEPSGSRTTSGSKRSRRAESVDVSDGHINIDLNAGSDAFPDAFDDDVEVGGSPLQRPPGRDKAKRVARFGDEQESKAKHRAEMEKQMREHLLETKEKKELRRQHLEFLRRQEENASVIQTQQQVLNHLSILEKKPSDYDDEDVEMVRELKAKSRSWIKKLGF